MKTIVALSTPPMNGAIHIIRISGKDAYKIINQITTTKIIKKGYQIQKTIIKVDNKIIDHVLINTFVAPKSFTGDDLIEINCHGGIYLAQKIIQLLISKGCVLAKNGEFSQRAYMNNKINIHQAEAINNLIKATNDKSIDLANNGLNKNILNKLQNLHEQIFKLTGQVEVNIDYPEYDDVPQMKHKQFKSIINNLLKQCNAIVDNSIKVIPLRDGVNVAIVGKPNVGKSSLLNVLTNSDRAIVSNVPGTTRDVICERININGITINLLDTAGYRDVKGKIEKIGIHKTIQTINQADFIIFLVDGSKSFSNEDKKIEKLISNKPYITVINKCDLTIKNKIQGIKISAKNSNVDNLIKTLEHKIKFPNFDLSNTIILQSNWEIGLIKNIAENLQIVKTILDKKQPIDLTMNYLHQSMENINTILGNGVEYNFINEMFKKFCVGK